MFLQLLEFIPQEENSPQSRPEELMWSRQPSFALGTCFTE